MALFGRTKQFRRSLETSWDRLYRVAYSWTHEAFIAHDLVQETMARALQHKDKITDHTALEIWLFKVMANYWRDLLRRRKDLTDIEGTQLFTDDTPDDATERSRLVMQVRKAISQLNPNQRQVITLVAMEGFSYEEVARILDIPVGTVMSRVCRARQTLKQLLSKTDSTQVTTDRVRRLK
jgi:RNA polymerase sigma-70 factor (ECF subfamily)